MRGGQGVVGVQEVHGGLPGLAEGRAVVQHEVWVGLVGVLVCFVGVFYVENIVLLDCFLEPVGESQDEMVRWGLREFVSSWRDLDGITAA